MTGLLYLDVPWFAHAPGLVGCTVFALNEAQARIRGGVALGVSAEKVSVHRLHGETTERSTEQRLSTAGIA